MQKEISVGAWKSYYVKSLPIKEVIENLAEEMDCSYIENCSYYCLHLPSHIGEGTIYGVQFTSGFALLNYDCLFHESTKIEFTFNQVHPLKFIHCYNGSVEHLFEGQDIAHDLNTYENIVVASSKRNGHILKFAKNRRVGICSVEIERSAFFEKISCLLEKESGLIVDAIMDRTASQEHIIKGRYNLAISSMIDNLTKIKDVNIDTIFLLEGHSYKLLSFQWIEFRKESGKLLLQKYDYQMFLRITDYVEKNIKDAITVRDITNAFLIGEKKIQSLFKSYASVTLNKYLQQYRLEKSIELLADSRNNISEVVYQLGLKNRSYFTKIFKEKYEMTPSAFTKKLLEN